MIKTLKQCLKTILSYKYTAIAILLDFYFFWLIFPLFSYESVYPVIFGYSLKLFLVLSFLTIVFLLIFLLSLFSSEEYIKYSLFSFLILFIVGETILSEPSSRLSVGYNNHVQSLMNYGREHNLPTKAANEFRILVLGGSTVYIGNPIEKSIPKQLQDLFHIDGFTNVKVFNSGLRSTTILRHIQHLPALILRNDPDLVFFYNAGNFVIFKYMTDPRPDGTWKSLNDDTAKMIFSGSRSWLESLSAIFFIKSKLLNKIMSQSMGLQFLYETFFLMRFTDREYLKEEYRKDEQRWIDTIAENYVDSARYSYQLSKKTNVKFATFLQPLVFFKDNITPSELPHTVLTGVGLSDQINNIYDTISEKCSSFKENDFYCFDVRNIFRNHKEEVFTDLIHIHDKYKLDVAKELYRKLLPIFQSKGDS